MRLPDWFAPSHRLPAMFAAVVLLPAAGMTWLAWRTLDQDRELERRRVGERLQKSADLLGAAFEERLRALPGQVEALLASGREIPGDSVVLSIQKGRIAARPAGRLLYLPQAPERPPLPPGVFSEGDRLEFRDRDYAAAARFYNGKAAGSNPGVRAAALVAAVRNLRKAGKKAAARTALTQLAEIGEAAVDGVPAALIARHERCRQLAEDGSAELEREAAALYADLTTGRWPLDRGMWEFYSGEARQWLRSAPGVVAPERIALAEAAVEIARLAQRDEAESGIRWMEAHGRPLLLAWNREHGKTYAVAAGPVWLKEWLRFGVSLGLNAGLYDASGRLVAGLAVPAGDADGTHSLLASGLPWTLRVGGDGANPGLFAGSRRSLLAAFGLAGLALVAGAFLVARALARELAVARLQSDFVAAVSHEFRSPLASMRHLTALLREGAIASESRRARYYDVLAKETSRLHRLVESLLDFRKMQSGRVQYNFAELDLARFASEAGAEFQSELGDPARLSIESRGEELYVEADREALGRAVHNLLDNAAKYSRACSPIRLAAFAQGGEVKIEVADEGSGIPENEQKKIFQAFYRGNGARALGVKGTGIGLAMVREIAGAHGGHVSVASSPGAGSRFAIVLPAVRRAGKET